MADVVEKRCKISFHFFSFIAFILFIYWQSAYKYKQNSLSFPPILSSLFQFFSPLLLLSISSSLPPFLFSHLTTSHFSSSDTHTHTHSGARMCSSSQPAGHFIHQSLCQSEGLGQDCVSVLLTLAYRRGRTQRRYKRTEGSTDQCCVATTWLLTWANSTAALQT